MTLMLNVDWRSLPNAPAAGTPLCALGELAPGEIREFSFPGDSGSTPLFRLIVYRDGDQVNAYVNQCPHHWLPMNRSDGVFLRWSHTELMCSHHSAVFNLAGNGECTMGPCQGSNLTRVPLQVSEGQIRIRTGD